jgi:hypothetical protein
VLFLVPGDFQETEIGGIGCITSAGRFCKLTLLMVGTTPSFVEVVSRTLFAGLASIPEASIPESILARID